MNTHLQRMLFNRLIMPILTHAMGDGSANAVHRLRPDLREKLSEQDMNSVLETCDVVQGREIMRVADFAFADEGRDPTAVFNLVDNAPELIAKDIIIKCDALLARRTAAHA